MEAMRDMMRRSLSQSLRELTAEDRLHAAWPLVCGSSLAGKAEVLHLDAEAVLHVRVTDREWRERFYEVRSRLCEDLSRIAGTTLTGIHFEQSVRRVTPPNKRDASAAARRSV